MEQYANFGFDSIKDKLNDNPNYFYKNTGFLNLILELSDVYSNADEAIEELKKDLVINFSNFSSTITNSTPSMLTELTCPELIIR